VHSHEPDPEAQPAMTTQSATMAITANTPFKDFIALSPLSGAFKAPPQRFPKPLRRKAQIARIIGLPSKAVDDVIGMHAQFPSYLCTLTKLAHRIPTNQARL